MPLLLLATNRYSRLGAIFTLTLAAACAPEAPPAGEPVLTTVEPRPDIYADFTLTADLSNFTDNQREMIKLLIDASVIMDDLYWRQAYGDDYEAWLASIGIDDNDIFR